jgi:hypothetical protein
LSVKSPLPSVVISAYPFDPGPQKVPSLSAHDQLYAVSGVKPVAVQSTQLHAPQMLVAAFPSVTVTCAGFGGDVTDPEDVLLSPQLSFA